MMRIIGMPGVIRVDHIGIAVFDLDAGVDWYQRFLGASLDLKGTTFQLIKPIGELSPVNKFLETRGEGLQQIALEVSNLDKSVDFALENHIRVIFEKSKNGTNGSRINFLHPKDCFGVLIELVEHPKVQLKLKQSE
jgi:methylmalonyl-CoA/ethylmalonyl-CoA epimerase